MKRSCFKQEQLRQELEAMEESIRQVLLAQGGGEGTGGEQSEEAKNALKLMMAQRDKLSRKLRELQLNQVRQRNFRERKKSGKLGSGGSGNSSASSMPPIAQNSIPLAAPVSATVLSTKNVPLTCPLNAPVSMVGHSTATAIPTAAPPPPFFFAFPANSSSPTVISTVPPHLMPHQHQHQHQPMSSLLPQEQQPPIGQLFQQHMQPTAPMQSLPVVSIPQPQPQTQDSSSILVQSISGSEQDFINLIQMFRTGNLSPEEQLRTTLNLTRLRQTYLEDCERLGELSAKAQLFLRLHSTPQVCAPAPAPAPTNNLNLNLNGNYGFFQYAPSIPLPMPDVEIAGHKEIGIADVIGQSLHHEFPSSSGPNIELVTSNLDLSGLTGLSDAAHLGLGAVDIEEE
jgi:hypothetical protein